MPASPLLTAAFTEVYEDTLMDAIHTTLSRHPPSNHAEMAVVRRLLAGLAVTATIGEGHDEEEYVDAVQLVLDTLDIIRDIHES